MSGCQSITLINFVRGTKRETLQKERRMEDKRRTWAGVRGSQQICPPKGETALKDADGWPSCADAEEGFNRAK